MKTLVLSMISIAATVAAMTACTSESDPVNELNPQDAKVEIKLNAGVGVITTKANAITTTDDINVGIIREDVEAATTPSWSTATAQTYKLSSTIALTGDQKYFDNEGKESHFIGYYPETGTKNGATINFKDVVGETDILCASPINAGTKANPKTETLTFKHMLSQVELVINGTTQSNTSFGKITKISLLNIATSLDLSLTDQTVTANTDKKEANIDIFSASAEADRKNITEIGTLDSKFIVPGYGSSTQTLTIQIETENFNTANNNARTIEIKNIITDNKEGLLAGYKHKITLTFNDNISIDTTIEGIKDNGGSGNGEIGQD